MTARTSQAALAVNTPEGRCARAEFFRSAWTCSMIACPRWVLSAATVSARAGLVVVKKAWKRQVSNSVSWPWVLPGLRSGIRRTTRRPGTCSDFFLEVNAVNGISVTSAREIQVWVCSSKTASVYSIGVQALSPIEAIPARTRLSSRTVTETSAPARSAAANLRVAVRSRPASSAT